MEMDEGMSGVSGRAYLSHGVGQGLDDLLMGGCHDTLPINLDDSMPHSHAATLRDAPSHQAADL